MKELLFGKTLSELREIVTAAGWPAYTASQMTDWLYAKGVNSIEQMTNLPVKVRAALAERFETGVFPPSRVQTSVDGTRKYLFATASGKFIETAMIRRGTVSRCVSAARWGARWGVCFA